MNLKKAILVLMLGIVVMPTIASAKPRGDGYSVKSAKKHGFFKSLFVR